MDFIVLDGLVKGLLLAWMWVNFTPWQNLLQKKVKPRILKWPYLANALGCLNCTSFWIVLFITLNPYTAILAALIAVTYDKIFHSFKTYL